VLGVNDGLLSTLALLPGSDRNDRVVRRTR